MNRREFELVLARVERLARDARDGRRERAGVLEEIVRAADAAREGPSERAARRRARIRVLERRRERLEAIADDRGMESRIQTLLAYVTAELGRIAREAFRESPSTDRARMRDGIALLRRSSRAARDARRAAAGRIYAGSLVGLAADGTIAPVAPGDPIIGRVVAVDAHDPQRVTIRTGGTEFCAITPRPWQHRR